VLPQRAGPTAPRPIQGQLFACCCPLTAASLLPRGLPCRRVPPRAGTVQLPKAAFANAPPAQVWATCTPTHTTTALQVPGGGAGRAAPAGGAAGGGPCGEGEGGSLTKKELEETMQKMLAMPPGGMGMDGGCAATPPPPPGLPRLRWRPLFACGRRRRRPGAARRTAGPRAPGRREGSLGALCGGVERAGASAPGSACTPPPRSTPAPSAPAP
jgi:hypothetical protein